MYKLNPRWYWCCACGQDFWPTHVHVAGIHGLAWLSCSSKEKQTIKIGLIIQIVLPFAYKYLEVVPWISPLHHSSSHDKRNVFVLFLVSFIVLSPPLFHHWLVTSLCAPVLYYLLSSLSIYTLLCLCLIMKSYPAFCIVKSEPRFLSSVNTVFMVLTHTNFSLFCDYGYPVFKVVCLFTDPCLEYWLYCRTLSLCSSQYCTLQVDYLWLDWLSQRMVWTRVWGWFFIFFSSSDWKNQWFYSI